MLACLPPMQEPNMSLPFKIFENIIKVDMSNIIDSTKKIIQLNNYSDKITLFKSKIEETELPVKNVDIIISEWMGYCLLYESMLESVIFARDKWLVHGGLLFPDVACIHALGIEDEEFREDKIEWWQRVYGYDMTPMKELALSEPLVDYVHKESIVTTDALIRRFDLYTVNIKDICGFQSNIVLTCRRRDFIHALVFYFTVEFTACHIPIVIYTGPEARPTHWKQTIFYLSEPLMVAHHQDIHIKTLICKNGHNKRHLDITLSICDGKDQDKIIQSRSYTLA
ncbi:hypothetical protein HZS_2687 [Henneguya salminicola]|nr:hypothetical protein HZS_2687 [Henneguya salminicola]